MWKIISINNEIHAVTVKNDDGDMFSFTVPAEHTRTHADKLAYMQSQMDARDRRNTVLDTLKKAKTKKHMLALYGVIALQAVAIVLHLVKVL